MAALLHKCHFINSCCLIIEQGKWFTCFISLGGKTRLINYHFLMTDINQRLSGISKYVTCLQVDNISSWLPVILIFFSFWYSAYGNSSSGGFSFPMGAELTHLGSLPEKVVPGAGSQFPTCSHSRSTNRSPWEPWEGTLGQGCPRTRLAEGKWGASQRTEEFSTQAWANIICTSTDEVILGTGGSNYWKVEKARKSLCRTF